METSEILRTCEQGGPEVTKQSIRVKVWDHMEKEDLANFPRPVHNRIPNFKGADQAGMAVVLLPEFSSAKTIKVNPDKPQEEVRYQALAHKKELLVPTPRLKSGLFNRLTNSGNNSKKELRILASRQGIDTKSTPVAIETKLSIDLVVIGSVAVDRLGHRIGKGEGFADLEFALAASHHEAVSQDTVVVTTVHDCQVFDSFPEHLFTDHDVPVDIIVTPTEVIRIEERLKKPVKIIWNLLTEEKLKQVSLLKTIRMSEKSAGADVTLYSESKTETKKAKIYSKTILDISQSNEKEANTQQNHGLYFSNIPKEIRVSEFKEALRSTGANLVFVRWKAFKQAAVVFFEGESGHLLEKFSGFEINDIPVQVEELKATEKDKIIKVIKDKEMLVVEEIPKELICSNTNELKNKNKEKKTKKKKKIISSLEEKSGLFFGQIPRKSKKSELLNALEERDAKPNHVEWYGRKGFAFAFWNEDSQAVFEKLKGLTIADSIINIEFYKKPLVPRIAETTDGKGQYENDEINCDLDKEQVKDCITSDATEESIDTARETKVNLQLKEAISTKTNEEETERENEEETKDFDLSEENESTMETTKMDNYNENEKEIELNLNAVIEVDDNEEENKQSTETESTYIDEQETDTKKEETEINCDTLDENKDEKEVQTQSNKTESTNIGEEIDEKSEDGETNDSLEEKKIEIEEILYVNEEYHLNKERMDEIQVENLVEDEYDTVQLPAANCCEIIRDLQEVNINTGKYEEGVEINFNESIVPIMRSSMSKLSLKSNSSQNIELKEKVKEIHASQQDLKLAIHKESNNERNKEKINIKDFPIKEKGYNVTNRNDIAIKTDIEKQSDSIHDKNVLKSKDPKTVHKGNGKEENFYIPKRSTLASPEMARNNEKNSPGKSREEVKINKKIKDEKPTPTSVQSELEKPMNTKSSHVKGHTVEKQRSKSNARLNEGDKSNKIEPKPTSPEPIKNKAKSNEGEKSKKNEPKTSSPEPNIEKASKLKVKSIGITTDGGKANKMEPKPSIPESSQQTVSKHRAKSNAMAADKEKSHNNEPKPSSPEPNQQSIHKQRTKSNSMAADKEKSHNNEPKPSSPEPNQQSISKQRAKSNARPADTEKSHKHEPKMSSPEPYQQSISKQRAKSNVRLTDSEKSHKNEPKPTSPESNSQRVTKQREKSNARLSDSEKAKKKEPNPSSPEPNMHPKTAPPNIQKYAHESTQKTNSKHATENPEKNAKSKSEGKTPSSGEQKSPKAETPGNKSEKDNCVIC